MHKNSFKNFIKFSKKGLSYKIQFKTQFIPSYGTRYCQHADKCNLELCVHMQGFSSFSLKVQNSGIVRAYLFTENMLIPVKINPNRGAGKPRNFQVCHSTLKLSDKKEASPMEIPLLFIDPWNFHILFFQYPWRFHFLNPHPPPHPPHPPSPSPVWIFFLEQPTMGAWELKFGIS